MTSLLTLSLCATVLVAGYLTVLCLTPPNPKADQTWKNDRIWIFYSPVVIRAAQILSFGIILHHAALVYLCYDGTTVDLNPQLFNTALFCWNWATAASLVSIICIGAPLRLAAYGALGGRFTFNLAPPNELQTTGVYRYVQHPSYSGLVIVAVAGTFVFFRWDASPGAWLPSFALGLLRGWGLAIFAAASTTVTYILSIRIRDEEAMLRDVFGKKWEDWHAQTSRVIPGLL